MNIFSLDKWGRGGCQKETVTSRKEVGGKEQSVLEIGTFGNN